MALPRLRPVAVGDLLRNVLDHGSAIDVWVGVEETLLDALLNDFSDGGLGQGSEIQTTHSLMTFLMVV